MALAKKTKHVRTAGFAILGALVASGAFSSGAFAVSSFGIERPAGEAPAEIDFDDIWFYDQDRSKQIPDISLEWIAAGFDAGTLEAAPSSFDGDADPKRRLTRRAKEIADAYDSIRDVYFDQNLAEDGCFFALRDGLREADIKDLVRALDREESIAYAHPMLIVQGRTVAYFNAFRMNWKAAVDDASRQDLMEQAHVSYEHPDEFYRVDVLAIPFFKAINLLAEDVRVLDVTPIFVPLETSIRVELSVPLQGCQIGDEIPFSLRIDFSERVRLDPSSLVNINLRPGQIQKELFDLKFDPYDYVKAVSQSPLTITGWMKVYSPGEFVIPAVEIHYECTQCSGDRIRSIKTEEIALKVASLVPSKGKRAELVVPVDNLKPALPTEALRRQARRFLWEAVVCFVLAAALLGWAGRKWVATRREGKGETAEKREDELAEGLRAYLARAPTGPHWAYAGDAGMQLREYLDAKYGLARDPRQASGAVFFEAVRGQLPGRVASGLGSLLEEIDRVIAQEIVQYPALERWKKDILELVRLAQANDP